jgi:creatinine amidohydrolase
VVAVDKLFIEDLTYEDLNSFLSDWCVVIVPVGSMESHGPHLPLSTDTMIAEAIALRAAVKLKSLGFRVLIGPRIRFGCSGEHLNFPGTISLCCESMIELIYDVCKSLANCGFKNILLLNGHGGNEAPLKAAAIKLRDEDSIMVAIVNWFDLISEGFTDHAGPMETSIIINLNFKPSTDHREVPAVKATSKYVSIKSKVQIPLMDMWSHTGGMGYLGDPSKASLDLGERLLDEASENLVKYIIEAKSRGHLFGRPF